MADVIPRARLGGDERGQLFLVTALAIAVMLVSLALILNTAIYTENIATRTTDTHLDDAASGQRAVVAATGSILDAENRDGNDTSAIASEFDSSLANWSETAGTLEAANGFTVDASYHGTNTAGVRVHQDDARRNFTDNTTDTDWEVIDDGRVRGMRFNVTRTSLAGSPSGAFNVGIDNRDGGAVDDVNLTMYDDGTNVNVTVRTDAGLVGSCVVEPESDGSLVVDVGSRTVGTQYCPPLEAVHDEVDGEVNLWFDNADEVTGTYELYATNDGGDLLDLLDGPEYASVGSGHWPVKQDALYDVNVSFTFHASGTTVEKEIRIAPGEL